MIVDRMIGIVVTAMVLLSPPTWAQEGVAFEAGCALPFRSIAVENKGIDDSCGIAGVASEKDVGNQQQNRIKNNFCLKSTPITLKTQDLVTLQSKVDALADFKYGSGRSVPSDRSPLKNIWSDNGSWEVDHLSKLVRIPLRLTGQLFFDASHVPCRPGKPVTPARKSVWEIHPIYRVDVCKSKKQCRVNVDSDWISLNEWVDSQEEQNASESEE